VKYQALTLLRTLDREEFSKFKLFVSSPYFTKKKNLLVLIEVLAKFHPHFENNQLTYKYLKSKLNNVNNSTLRNYFSDLKDLLIKYLMHINLENNKQEQYIVTMEELENRNLINLYKKEKIKYVKHINNPNLEFKPDDYFYLYRFNLIEKNILVNTDCIKKGKNYQISEVEIKIENYLSKYYLLESLKSWIQCKMHHRYFNMKIDEPHVSMNTFFREGKEIDCLFENIINEERDNKRKRVLETYFLIYQCYKENTNTEDLYKSLQSLLETIMSLPCNVEGYEYQYILSVSRNAYFELRIKNVYETNLKSKFDLLYLESYLRHGGDPSIPNFSFSAILLESLLDFNLEFAQNIFKKYQKYSSSLFETFHENCIKFLEHFINQNFTGASEVYLKLKTKDINTKRRLKLLQIYLQYEMGNYDYCITLSENFKKFIHNHKNEHSRVHIEHINNICNVFKLLCNIRINFNKDKLIELERMEFPLTIFLQKKRQEILKEYKVKYRNF